MVEALHRLTEAEGGMEFSADHLSGMSCLDERVHLEKYVQIVSINFKNVKSNFAAGNLIPSCLVHRKQNSSANSSNYLQMPMPLVARSLMATESKSSSY